MKQQMPTQMQSNLQQAEAATRKLGAAILWLLGDRTWHSVQDFEFLELCVAEAEGRAQYELMNESEKGRGEFDYDPDPKVSKGKQDLISAAIEWLVQNNLCKSRGIGQDRELQRIRLNNLVRAQVTTLKRMEAAVVEAVQGWLEEGRPIQTEGLMWEIYNLFPEPVDDYTAIPVACEVAFHLADQVEYESEGEEDPCDEDVEPAALDHCMAEGADAEQCAKSDWCKAGFFDPRQLFYFNDGDASKPSQILCKALLIQILTNPKMLPPDEALQAYDPDAMEEWTRHNLSRLLTGSMGHFLGVAWQRWTEMDPPPPGYHEERGSDSYGWIDWVDAKLDWSWVASKIQGELQKHGHRRGLRARELALGMPYEHIEARLDGFIGSLEEEFLHVMQGK